MNNSIRTSCLDFISNLMRKWFRGSFIHRSKVANKCYQSLWRLLADQGSTRLIEFRNLSIVVPSDEITILPSLIDGTYEHEEIDAFLAEINPNAIVLDIGANIGMFALPVAKYLTGGFIYAFEPSTESSMLLLENIQRNNLKNIEVIEKAASSVSGQHSFLNAEVGGRRRIVEDGVGEQVQAVVIDDWAAERHLFVDAVKIDVEGWESSVLQGMEIVLRSSPVLLLECNMAAQGKNVLNFRDQLKDLFQRYDRIVSFDGFKITHLDKSDWQRVTDSKVLLNLLFSKKR